MTASDPHPDELLRQAIAIGENMIRIADAIDQPLAGNYFSIGLDLLRRAAGEVECDDDGTLCGYDDPAQIPDK